MRVKIKLFLFLCFFSLFTVRGVFIATAAGAGSDGSWIRSNLDRAADALSEHMNAKTATGITASMLLLGREEEFTAGQLLAISLLGSAAVTTGLKYAINRERPTPPTERRNSSFPSGHAAAAFAAAAVFGDCYPRLAVPAYLFAGSVAYSRLYLRRHYPSDVVAGALIGILSAHLAAAHRDRLTIRGRGLIGAMIGTETVGLIIIF